jgi:hypothetical protein
MASNPVSNVISIENRVEKLELNMTNLSTELSGVKLEVSKAVANTDQLISLATGVRNVSGFLSKHGPRLVAFATGVAASLGIGNPNLLKFVEHFFS